MSIFNVSVDDTSPLIKYSERWFEVSPTNDNISMNYFLQSAHSTTRQNSTVTFSFNGTGVWIFGSRRPDRSDCSISIDGGPILRFNESIAGAARYNVFLAGTGGLQNGPHTVVLNNTQTNPRKPHLDIDRIVFETQIDNATNVEPVFVDDTDPKIVYNPSRADWTASSNLTHSELSYNKTLSETTVLGASISFSFEGEAVEVLGAVSEAHGGYTVTLDGKEVSHDAKAEFFHSQTSLFFSNGLGPGRHDLVVSNGCEDGDGFKGALSIDAIRVWGGPVDPSSTGGQAQPTQTATPSNVSRNTVGPILGSVAGFLGFIALLFCAMVIFLRKRQKDSESRTQMPNLRPLSSSFSDGGVVELGMVEAPVPAARSVSIRSHRLSSEDHPLLRGAVREFPQVPPPDYTTRPESLPASIDSASGLDYLRRISATSLSGGLIDVRFPGRNIDTSPDIVQKY